MNTVTIRISKEAKRQLTAHAKSRKQTLSQTLEDALRRLRADDRWSRAAKDQTSAGIGERRLMKQVNRAAMKLLRASA